MYCFKVCGKKLSNREKQVYLAHIERHKKRMPWYIIEYTEEKTNLFTTTWYGYLIEYEIFLQRLISSCCRRWRSRNENTGGARWNTFLLHKYKGLKVI